MTIQLTAEVQELEDAELAAWRGMLRVHSALVKALDAELEAAHGLPLSSYEARGCFAVLTDQGEEVLAGARATHLSGVRRRFLAHLDADDIATLGTAFNK